MLKHMQAISKFMQCAGQEIPDKPCIPEYHIRRLRGTLILEECLETIAALGLKVIKVEGKHIVVDSGEEPDLVQICDGVADTSVVSIGTTLACGVNPIAIIREVDRANLDKFRGDAHRREDGKWIKPSDWKAPEIEKLLMSQGWEG